MRSDFKVDWGDEMSDRMEASNVSEMLLKKTGEAIITGDFDTYLDCFFLPQEIETFEGSRWLLEPADVRDVFDSTRQFFSDRGISDIVRRCVAAHYTGPDTIEATHESRLLAGDQIVAGPYPCFSILQKIDGNWMITFNQAAVDRNDVQINGLSKVDQPEMQMRKRG